MVTKDIGCLVLHHNDADGKCAGAIVDYFEEDCRLYSINYGYDVPWKLIKRARKVYMVDFCLQPFSDMLKIKDMLGDDFIWIDHHMTAIQNMIDSGQKFNGLQRVGKDTEDILLLGEMDPKKKIAGCELTWHWFTDGLDDGKEAEMPPIVRMIGRYDIWDLDYSEDIMPVQFGLRLYQIEADNKSVWRDLFEDGDVGSYHKLVEHGQSCHEYQTIMNKSYCGAHAFEMEWEGYNFMACNAMHTNSKLFDSKFDHSIHDAVLVFGWSNGNWTFSMYTDKEGIDVGTLAKKYGGGGHMGAAGFQCNNLPFPLPHKA